MVDLVLRTTVVENVAGENIPRFPGTFIVYRRHFGCGLDLKYYTVRFECRLFQVCQALLYMWN